jgi:hypothetical protein
VAQGVDPEVRKKKRMTTSTMPNFMELRKLSGEEGWDLRKSNIDRVNLIRVHCMHVCKYHSETPLYN